MLEALETQSCLPSHKTSVTPKSPGHDPWKIQGLLSTGTKNYAPYLKSILATTEAGNAFKALHNSSSSPGL